MFDKYEGTDGACLIGIEPNTRIDYWLIGDSFIRGFYVAHDLENKKLGLVPGASTTPARWWWVDEGGLDISAMVVVLICGGVVIVGGIILAFVYNKFCASQPQPAKTEMSNVKTSNHDEDSKERTSIKCKR